MHLTLQLTQHPPLGHSLAREQRFSNETDEWQNSEEDSPPKIGEFIDDDKKIRIIANGNDLGGELRYLAEGFLNISECQSLVKLAQVTGRLIRFLISKNPANNEFL